MNANLTLCRHPRTYALFGVLVVSVAGLMLFDRDRSAEQAVFGVLFLVGGFSAVAYINRLKIDAHAHELVHQRGLVVPLHSKRYPLDKIKAIRISCKVVRRNKRDWTTFPIHLSGIKGAVISNHGNPWFSRVLAEQLAMLVGVPLINRVYGESSTRPPEELELPLIRRWIRDDVRFDMPARPPGSELREALRGSAWELSIPAELPALKYVAALLFLATVPAVVDVPPVEIFHSAVYRLFAAIMSVAAIRMLALIGRSNLKITPREVSFRQGYLPFRSRLPIAEIEEMIVAGDGITLVGDTGAVRVPWGGSKRDSEYLEAVVPYKMLRLGRYALSDARNATPAATSAGSP